jgi:hypothetical protein
MHIRRLFDPRTRPRMSSRTPASRTTPSGPRRSWKHTRGSRPPASSRRGPDAPAHRRRHSTDARRRRSELEHRPRARVRNVPSERPLSERITRGSRLDVRVPRFGASRGSRSPLVARRRTPREPKPNEPRNARPSRDHPHRKSNPPANRPHQELRTNISIIAGHPVPPLTPRSPRDGQRRNTWHPAQTWAPGW